MTTPCADRMSGGRRLWRIGRRLLRSLLLVYLLVCLLMYALQTSLIFPGAATQGTGDAQIKPGDGESLVPLKAADGVELTGLFASADPARPAPHGGMPSLEPDAPLPTLLYFYGNGECMATATFVADRFRAMGYHCMLVDYEGFGLSGGKPSEPGCYAAAEAAYQYVLTRPEVDKRHLVAAGWSLGGAVAIDLAARHQTDGTICSVMTFSSFTSMVDLAQHLYPVLPVGLMLKHRFMSLEKIAAIKVPYFNGHGSRDSMIPFAFAERLCGAAGCGPSQVTRYESRSDHNDFFDVDQEMLNGKMVEFLVRVTRQ